MGTIEAAKSTLTNAHYQKVSTSENAAVRVFCSGLRNYMAWRCSQCWLCDGFDFGV